MTPVLDTAVTVNLCELYELAVAARVIRGDSEKAVMK